MKTDSIQLKRVFFVFFCMHAIAVAALMLIGVPLLIYIGWDAMGGYGVEVLYLIFFVLAFVPARKIRMY